VASVEPIVLLGGSSTGKSSDAVTRMATCRQSQVLLNEEVHLLDGRSDVVGRS
jgi:hypothetical protein